MTAETIPKPKASESVWSDSDPVVLVLTIGFILLFVGASVVDADYVAELIGHGFSWTAKYLGSFFQLLLLLTFFVAVATGVSGAGRARIGGLDEPEMSGFQRCRGGQYIFNLGATANSISSQMQTLR